MISLIYLISQNMPKMMKNGTFSGCFEMNIFYAISRKFNCGRGLHIQCIVFYKKKLRKKLCLLLSFKKIYEEMHFL